MCRKEITAKTTATIISATKIPTTLLRHLCQRTCLGRNEGSARPVGTDLPSLRRFLDLSLRDWDWGTEDNNV